ncbi:type II toxin-antitoxin system Phd/YefM family antitoxin [Gemmatimonas sp.]|uniref:type II toxin-antitoxin system Phd/YefM family antitoxin n=2 Tax=Gemmatimonas sp. TaxID=1962908 RepID=UPI003563F72A
MPKKVVRESVALYDAKTPLSALVDRAAAGEEIVIMKSGYPMARLVPMEDTRYLLIPGQGRGLWKVTRTCDEPLPDSVLDTFEAD